MPRTANAAIDANTSYHTLIPHLHCSLEIVGDDILDQRLSHDLLCAVTNQSASAFVPDVDMAERINSKDGRAGRIDYTRIFALLSKTAGDVLDDASNADYIRVIINGQIWVRRGRGAGAVWARWRCGGHKKHASLKFEKDGSLA